MRGRSRTIAFVALDDRQFGGNEGAAGALGAGEAPDSKLSRDPVTAADGTSRWSWVHVPDAQAVSPSFVSTAPDAVRASWTLAAMSAAGAGDGPPMSSDRIEPGASVALASGAPKFDVLATSRRSRSSTGWLAAASAPPGANGPPL